MSFTVVGFDKDAPFRFTAILSAVEAGLSAPRFGVISDPIVVGQKIVCVRCSDFGAVFKPEEVYRICKTVKRVPAFPQWARRFADDLKSAAEDASFASETSNKAMI